MPRMRRKGDLPQKTCAQCGRPFAWRRKWERVWDEVRYCSDRCRGEAKRRAEGPAGPDPGLPRSGRS
ncbi:MAG: DUF2256 domain-containing protein [Methylobacterium sp.]|uniref:DUF2256 domain-containing protein n=1 Tax=Methylobacterium sp. TaxID=409 RepID=UPI0025891C64|nr:DUF2256 domain-containing protein [Methylobacterium sp.]MBY0299645.1 DUF2256 domain-containing protein [Methylobacterium sp.]